MNTFPTIISRDCIGGYIYKEMNQKFSSPTIGLYMTNDDFITFCLDLPEFLTGSLEPIESDKPYPRCKITSSKGEIKINFMHYTSLDEAIEKWQRRKLRVDYNNIKIIMDAKPNVSKDIVCRFQSIPYDKVLLSSGENIRNVKDTFCMPCYLEASPPDTLIKHSIDGRFIDEYDWRTFVLKKDRIWQ